MVFLSLGVRALVNVEALNMVESVGNIVRHRKAAIVYKRDSAYVVRWVPAVSGESLAHSYQALLAFLARQRGLPVCTYCSKHEFVKHADRRIFGDLDWEKKLASRLESIEGDKGGKKSGKQQQVNALEVMHEVEKTIITNCVVEDIGGFLYAGKKPVKRTSRFSCSFMIPALDAVEKAVVETQFQVRHAPTASQVWDQAQMPYNVEVGSAVYAWSFYMDLSSIGCTSAVKSECLGDDERRKRVELAIDALALMLDSRLFGAKHSRFMPVVGYELILVTLSKPLPFNVSPPAMGPCFVEDTVKRIEAFVKATNSSVEVYGYAGDGDAEKLLKANNVKVYKTIVELFEEVKRKALEWLKLQA